MYRGIQENVCVKMHIQKSIASPYKCKKKKNEIRKKHSKEIWVNSYVIREGNDTPLQYSCLENPMDGGAW